MNHYECWIISGKRTPDHLHWHYTRQSPTFYIDAKTGDQARDFVRQKYLDRYVRAGEELDYIRAKMVSTAYVLEKLGQKRLL